MLCDRVPLFDQDLNRFLAMREVIDHWKGDQYKPEAARKLALDRESNDLSKLEDALRKNLKQSLERGHIVFRGASRALSPKPGIAAGEMLRGELATYFPTVSRTTRKFLFEFLRSKRRFVRFWVEIRAFLPKSNNSEFLIRAAR